MKNPTLAEIAELAGTSPQAVSRILNPRSSSTSNFSESLKQRVEGIARDLNYKPRRKPKSSNRRILFIMESTSERLSAVSTRDGILVNQESTWKYQSYIRLLNRHEERVTDEDLAELEEFIMLNRIDGVVCVHHSNVRLFDICRRCKIPIVFINPNTVQATNCLLHNDEQGIALSLQVLRLLGYERVVYVGPVQDKGTYIHHSVEQRRLYVEDECRKHNMAFTDMANQARKVSEQLQILMDTTQPDKTVAVSYGDISKWLGEADISTQLPPLFTVSDSMTAGLGCIKLQDDVMCDHALCKLLLMIEKHIHTFENMYFNETITLSN